ncbi:hypothetical protein E2C01_037165 [Portunus trituberculatus]|uniref:Uncharacterized protein n=1 Tax=Portunus trituberculatus TaxID=210409 RepID=A0A5B7FDX5_PORTR|nr:hypothetical protein [Portunus trituberculatus]
MSLEPPMMISTMIS